MYQQQSVTCFGTQQPSSAVYRNTRALLLSLDQLVQAGGAQEEYCAFLLEELVDWVLVAPEEQLEALQRELAAAPAAVSGGGAKGAVAARKPGRMGWRRGSNWRRASPSRSNCRR